MNQPGKPFAARRRVRWGDCDPAGIIYTPRVIDYATEALEAWTVEILGVNWVDLNWKMDMGAPMVRIECDYLKALKPDQEIDITVRVERMGTSTVTYAIDGWDDDKDQYFHATFVSCFISRPDFKSTPVPDDFRDRIAAYQAECGDAS